MIGLFNKEAGGIITLDFLKKEVEKLKKNKYLILRGYFEHGNMEKNKCMTLMAILNYMFSQGFSFKSFISRDQDTFGELLFENNDV